MAVFSEKKIPKKYRGGLQLHHNYGTGPSFMLSISRSLQDNFDGKNSYKSTKYWPSYDIMSQLALLGFKGLSL